MIHSSRIDFFVYGILSYMDRTIVWMLSHCVRYRPQYISNKQILHIIYAERHLGDLGKNSNGRNRFTDVLLF